MPEESRSFITSEILGLGAKAISSLRATLEDKIELLKSMIIKCITNNASYANSSAVEHRLRRWTDADGRYNDLETGREYKVQAIEYMDDGFFYYVQTDDFDEYPYPFAAEFFIIADSSIPEDWEVSVRVDQPTKFKRLTFREWAKDDQFFEKLLNGEPEYVAIYANCRV